ncbi:hypothetical protein CU669_20800 [Paramagnetospirillum kuznetsovii]|uniref:protein O-GlcNAc transferase n=2 Tax=Paramagnetospirillum kuznetsovii TaxID=2053833 RepID=A0A364NSX1_9PROT|nr:hypothetical protein CU669_20800 [Paramagnetospirillum kuznetsovii]
MKQGKMIDSVAACRRALAIRPDHAAALANLGAGLQLTGRIDESLDACRRALAIRPDHAAALSTLCMTAHYSTAVTGAEMLSIARAWARLHERADPAPIFDNDRARTRPLRVGYVSGDLHAHPVGFFLGAVLPAHDRQRVEVTCYTTSARVDDVTVRLQQGADRWRSLIGLSDDMASALIRQDAIDVLVDLSGLTPYNRLPMFARRAAPVQATWLGYFGTTGLAAMDYILADRFVIPEGEEGNFSETVWRLPDSYLCFEQPPFDIAVEEPPARQTGSVTFGCFNRLSKISPETIALWSAVLHAAPVSTLLLKSFEFDDDALCASLRSRFATYGIDPDRVTIEGPEPRQALLRSYNRVDVALDPLPYGGGTTTAEALWMGVPVVTLRGDRWVGRVSESIQAAAGLSELVAPDVAAYVALASGLAANLDFLGELRAALRPSMVASPLCDGKRFARNLEDAYHGMWQAWCKQTVTKQ